MKYSMLLLCLLMASSVQAEVVPMTLAGITLGSDVAAIRGICRMHTEIVLPQERHLTEIQLKPGFAPGVRSGSVAYATCAEAGRIVRIKLKFDDDSRDFFEELLRRYTRELGEPREWRGDPFQTVMSWKWSFRGADGRQVNLELTHSEDEDYKTGNFVKMTLRSLWEAEQACQQKKDDAEGGDDASPPAPITDFRPLIPQ